jgi:hypothetical protein
VVSDMSSRDMERYLNVDNHCDGSAPLTMEKLPALGVLDQGMSRHASADRVVHRAAFSGG